MTRHLRALPRHALAALRSDLARDLCALAVVGLFTLMIILWSVTIADQVSFRRFS